MEAKYSYDIIERTLKLLEQYDKQLLQEDEKFEVTLLLNACVGLLFVCKEKYEDKLPINAKHLYTIQAAVTIETDISLFSICRHIRNSIAHCNFELNSSAKKVSSITFKDYPKGQYNLGKENFMVTIPVKTLQEFLIDVAIQTTSVVKQINPK